MRRASLNIFVCWLLGASAAFARAGGGSGGFGGGGGGGGAISGPAFLIIIGAGAVILVFGAIQEARKKTFTKAYGKTRDALTARRRERRRAEIERAALVAAEDDLAFASDRVHTEADDLFRDIQAAWDQGDRAALARLMTPDLALEWGLRLDDFDRKGWQNRVTVKSSGVEYVGITNRLEDHEDRVVVRVSALLRDVVLTNDNRTVRHTGNSTDESEMREYWTLGKRDGRWILLTIEQDEEGEYQLEAPVEADPSDDARLTDQSRVEAAVADALPANLNLADVADADARTAMTKAHDLALVDKRFDPDIIDATVRRGVAGWAQAIDGDDGAFASVARPELVKDLLYPTQGGHTLRVVVRNPQIRSTQLVHLDTDSVPPTATVHIEIEGVRYVEDRNTLVVVAGSQNKPSRFASRWTLTLDGPDESPWRIASVLDDGAPTSGSPAPAAR